MAWFDKKAFNPEAWAKYVDSIPVTKRQELRKSGAVVPDARLYEMFYSQTQTGSAYAIIPYFAGLGGEPLNYDGETDLTSTGTSTMTQGVGVLGRMKKWGEYDFSYDITGGVAFEDFAARQVAEYWANVEQGVILSMLEGVFSMTGKQNEEFIDLHTTDISDSEEDTETTEKNLMTATTLNDALQKAAGDNKSLFGLIIMHSAVATNLENLQLLQYSKYTDQRGITRDLTLGTWNGRTVLIDDSMPTETVEKETNSYSVYTSYVLGNGAIKFQPVPARVPYELSRDTDTGGGMEFMISRQRYAFGLEGISYERKKQATNSPTNEELADGSNWTLVNGPKVNGSGNDYVDHKAVPFARIISRG